MNITWGTNNIHCCLCPASFVPQCALLAALWKEAEAEGCGSHGNGKPTFSFGCANMTKWPMHSPKVYKPSLLLVIPWVCPHF